MHKLLAIQLRKHLGIQGDETSPIPAGSPLLETLAPFLEAVDSAYVQFDRDLSLGHRSLTLSNEELQVMYERQHQEMEQRLEVLEGLRRTTQRLLPESNRIGIPELDAKDPRTLVILMERLVREREEAKTRLEGREAQYRSVLEALKEVVFQLDQEGRWLYLNRAWAELTGFTVQESIGRYFEEWIPLEERAEMNRRFQEIKTGRIPLNPIELQCLTRDGGTKWVKLHAQAPKCNTVGVSGTLSDITEQKRSETALLQAQKLESLGVLAGGIAHDFNNLLVAIMGNAELAARHLNDPPKARRHLDQVSVAIERSAELCRQLLAYSGKGRFATDVLDLNALVEEMTHLLRVSIGKGVILDYHLTPNLPPIEADPSQIRQAVMNLVINASEALDNEGGIICIETGLGLMETDPKFRSYLSHDLADGPSVYLRVQDSGCGMDEETLKRIFDPFFTTKFTGRGLGLAAILGIVRSHKGALQVKSQVGRGTTFCLNFPATHGLKPMEAPARILESPFRGHGTILLVDDEPTVREIMKEILEAMGFGVVQAFNGQEGVDTFRRRMDEFIAVFLDLTMPVMGGEEAFQHMQRIRPGIPVILTSGYSEQEAICLFNHPGMAGFLQKPFRIAELNNLLQRVLATT